MNDSGFIGSQYWYSEHTLNSFLVNGNYLKALCNWSQGKICCLKDSVSCNYVMIINKNEAFDKTKRFKQSWNQLTQFLGRWFEIRLNEPWRKFEILIEDLPRILPCRWDSLYEIHQDIQQMRNAPLHGLAAWHLWQCLPHHSHPLLSSRRITAERLSHCRWLWKVLNKSKKAKTMGLHRLGLSILAIHSLDNSPGAT